MKTAEEIAGVTLLKVPEPICLKGIWKIAWHRNIQRSLDLRCPGVMRRCRTYKRRKIQQPRHSDKHKLEIFCYMMMHKRSANEKLTRGRRKLPNSQIHSGSKMKLQKFHLIPPGLALDACIYCSILIKMRFAKRDSAPIWYMAIKNNRDRPDPYHLRIASCITEIFQTVCFSIWSLPCSPTAMISG